jgi:uncharacterized protein YbjT (DUF2867 family)
MISVVGGRSKIGQALIEQLVADGQQVQALVRERKPAGGLHGGLRVVTGDLAHVGLLRVAVHRTDRLLLLSGPTERELEPSRQAIDAARKAGIGLVVHGSILGADPSSRARFVRDHGVDDGYLPASRAGVPAAA